MGITMITNDHRNVEEIFGRYEQASEPDEKLRLVAKRTEESNLLPRLREALSQDELRTLVERLRKAKASAVVSPSQESGSKRRGAGEQTKD